MLAVRRQLGDFGQGVVEILGYKYPPVTVRDILNTVQLLCRFDFRAAIVPVTPFSGLRLPSLELL